MTTWSSNPDGSIADSEIRYIERRQGYGLFITAACYVHPGGKAFHGQWSCSRDEDLTSLRRACEAIHQGGAAAFLQIHHGGRMCPAELCGGQPVSASDVVADRPYASPPRAMNEEEIREVIKAFAEAARRAKESGYDGVEIHGANTYLLQQFVSPLTNLREDSWGQDRHRFPLEVVDAVMSAVGPGFPVAYRFSPEESEPEGLTLDHTFRFLDALMSRPLAYLHISLRDFRAGSLRGEHDVPTLGLVHDYVDGRLPLVGVGSVVQPEDAEQCLDDCELVALGRAAITEPEWPHKALTGQPVRTVIPRNEAGEVLTIPKGLEDKIYSVPGWFNVQD